MVEHVVLEQHLCRAALETSQVEQQDTARRQIGYSLGGQIGLPACDRDEEAR
jgi:hypothetical protein